MSDYSLPYFSWNILDELPSDQSVIQFPRNPISYAKSYVVQVTSRNGNEWIGNFKGIDKHYYSGVILWPEPNRICVIAHGSAYVVQADNPDFFEELRIVPIIDAHTILEPSVAILATFWDLYAFGEKGFLWRTENLAIDGLKIEKIENGSIYGVSKSFEQDKPFMVDLRTGETKGGHSHIRY